MPSNETPYNRHPVENRDLLSEAEEVVFSGGSASFTVTDASPVNRKMTLTANSTLTITGMTYGQELNYRLRHKDGPWTLTINGVTIDPSVSANEIEWNTSHYNFDTLTIDAAAAVDAGGGLVTIPIDDHPFSADETVVIAGTTNYDGSEAIVSAVAGVSITITATYVAETFAGTETATRSAFDLHQAGAPDAFV